MLATVYVIEGRVSDWLANGADQLVINGLVHYSSRVDVQKHFLVFLFLDFGFDSRNVSGVVHELRDTLLNHNLIIIKGYYINLGWNVRGLVDDNVQPKPDPYQATFVFSPRLSGYRW